MATTADPFGEGFHPDKGSDLDQLKDAISELTVTLQKLAKFQMDNAKEQSKVFKDLEKFLDPKKNEDDPIQVFTKSQQKILQRMDKEVAILREIMNSNVKMVRITEANTQQYRRFINDVTTSKDYEKAMREVSQKHGKENRNYITKNTGKILRDQLVKDVPLLGMLTGNYINSPGSDKWQRSRHKEMSGRNAENETKDVYSRNMLNMISPGEGDAHMDNIDKLYGKQKARWAQGSEFLNKNAQPKKQQRKNKAGRYMRDEPLMIEDMRGANTASTSGPTEEQAQHKDAVTKTGPERPTRADVQKLPAAYSTGSLYVGGLLEDFFGEDSDLAKEIKKTSEKKGGGGGGGLFGGGGGGGMMGGLGGAAVGIYGAILGGQIAGKVYDMARDALHDPAKNQIRKLLTGSASGRQYMVSRGLDARMLENMNFDGLNSLYGDYQMFALANDQSYMKSVGKTQDDIRFMSSKDIGAAWWEMAKKKTGVSNPRTLEDLEGPALSKLHEGGAVPGTKGVETTIKAMPGETVLTENTSKRMEELLAQNVDLQKQLLEELRKNTEATSSIKMETKKVPPSATRDFLKTGN